MKAIVQHRYGLTDQLQLQEVEVPTVGARDVLVRVRAAGVDPGVWHLVTGMPYLVRLGSGLRRPRRRIPGMDLAGVVEAVGRDVTRFAPGDEVFGTGKGSYAEYAVAPARTLAAKPANLSFTQAAAVPVSGQTALNAVRGAVTVRPGQQVLVIGAGGGVGTFAVPLAKASGAHVTGVCSTRKHDLVRSIGADEVIDYTREDVADRGARYDLIIDTGGNRPLAQLRRALLPSGTLVLVGGEAATGKWLKGFDRQLRAHLLSPWVGHRLVNLVSLPKAAQLEVLTGLIDSGQVTPVVDRTYPLDRAPEAIRHLESHPQGKLVISA